MRSLLWSAGFLVGLLAPNPSAHGTTLIEMSWDELTAGAEAVVRGRVVDIGYRVTLSESGVQAMTIVDLQVHTWLRGRGPGRVRLWEEGGRLPDGSWWVVEGAPQFRIDEEVVVFLTRDGLGRRHTHQMAQGKLTVEQTVDGTFLQRDLSEQSVVRGSEGSFRIRPGPTLRVPFEQIFPSVRGRRR